ncbi:MAG: hypothetical protein Tsb0019_01560 [Roseibium sp.]
MRTRQPFIWDACHQAPLATNPDNWPGNRPGPDRSGTPLSLFGFAPGGVYHAAAVASCAVGSYPTLSPLLRKEPLGLSGAVCFLWHFP